MRLNSTSLFAAVLVTLALGACAPRGQVPLSANLEGDDDKYCRANGGPVGTPDYSNCLKNRDVQRSNAITRADRAQRNLGQYMLNNTDAPGYVRQ